MLITRKTLNQGFTIIELLVVIVVIGILASITIISYNGVQTKARQVVVQSDVKNAASQLEIDNVTNGSYPSTVAAANGGSGLRASDGTSYEYTLTGGQYCLTATNGTISYYISSANGAPTAGLCPGHTGGQPVPDPEVVTTFVGSYSSSGSADGTGASAQFQSPQGITIASNGDMYVADGTYRIRKITTAGVVTTLAGSTNGYADGTGSAAQFSSIYDIAIAPNGDLYVTDSGNHTIRKVTQAGVVTTLAGSTSSGNADGTGAAARFYYPKGIVMDSNGDMFVADAANNRIRKVTQAGVVTTLAGSSYGLVDGTGTAAKFSAPNGLAIDSTGNLFVGDSDSHTIRKVTQAGVVTTLAGSSTSGSADGTGSSAGFYRPRGIETSASGDLYVVDGFNHRLRKVTQAGVVTTLAGSTSGYADGTGSSAQFSYPEGIAIDANGDLFIADSNNNCIRKVTAQ